MDTRWAGRIGEGLVIGITASVGFMLFTNLVTAREELTEARETLEIQFDVNQELLDDSTALAERVEDMEFHLRGVKQQLAEVTRRERGNTVGSANPSPSSDEEREVSETSHSTPTEIPNATVFEPVESSTIQQRIDEQRRLVR